MLAILAYRLQADWEQLPLAAFHLSPVPLAASWAVQTVGWILAVDTWRRILALTGADVDRLSLTDHLESHTYSSLGNVVPGSIWLPASRLALYRRQGISPVAVSGAVVIEWLALGLGGLALYGLTVPFASSLPGRSAAWLGVAAAFALVGLHPRVLPMALSFAARRLGDEALEFSLPPKRVAGVVAREWMVLVLSGLGLYALMVAIAPAASLPDALSAWALTVAVANLLAWVPMTLILKDAAMVLALVPLYGEWVALGVVIAWRIWMTAVLASWAAVAFLGGRLGRRRPNGV